MISPVRSTEAHGGYLSPLENICSENVGSVCNCFDDFITVHFKPFTECNTNQIMHQTLEKNGDNKLKQNQNRHLQALTSNLPLFSFCSAWQGTTVSPDLFLPFPC